MSTFLSASRFFRTCSGERDFVASWRKDLGFVVLVLVVCDVSFFVVVNDEVIFDAQILIDCAGLTCCGRSSNSLSAYSSTIFSAFSTSCASSFSSGGEATWIASIASIISSEEINNKKCCCFFFFNITIYKYACLLDSFGRPRGLMDMASDFESGSCGFESHRGQNFFFHFYSLHSVIRT